MPKGHHAKPDAAKRGAKPKDPTLKRVERRMWLTDAELLPVLPHLPEDVRLRLEKAVEKEGHPPVWGS